MAHHILGQSRTQTTLLPEVLDDFVNEDNPVRVVDVFVDGLDLQTLGFERVIAQFVRQSVDLNRMTAIRCEFN